MSRVIDKFLFHLRLLASKELISAFVSLINSRSQCILTDVIWYSSAIDVIVVVFFLFLCLSKLLFRTSGLIF